MEEIPTEYLNAAQNQGTLADLNYTTYESFSYDEKSQELQKHAVVYLDYILYELLWKWAKRRHPHKGRWWVSTKYWHRVENRSWVFSTDKKELLRVDHIPIIRHTKVRMDANPYFDAEYFKERKFSHGMKRLSGRFKMVWKNQNGCCYHCGLPMEINEEREIFFYYLHIELFEFFEAFA